MIKTDGGAHVTLIGRASLIQRMRVYLTLGAVKAFPVRRFRQSIAERLLPPGTSDLDFEVGFFGSRYRGNLGRRIDWSVFFLGAYELASLKLFALLLSTLRQERGRGAIVFDIGANVGHHTLFFSRFAHEVLSFEPLPFYYRLLEQKIARNTMSNVHLHKVALGETNELQDYYQDKSPNATGKFLFIAKDNLESDAIKLPVCAGDEYLRANNIPFPDLIKIDTDGFEGLVLRGLSGTIKEARPIIFSEFSPESRRFINSEAQLRDSLYPGAELFTVIDDRWTQQCRLSSFVFSDTHNFLVVPPELKLAVLEGIGASGAEPRR